MKLSVKKVDALKRELRFEISGERIVQKKEETLAEISRVAKIKGFRPGKAPRQVVEANYGDYAKEEMIKKIIPEVYREGLEQEKIDPLDLPEINDVQFKNDVLTFTAVVDIKPEVKVKDYKGIKVKRKSSKVTEEEMNKTLDYLKKSQGKDDAVIDDAFVKGLGYPTLDSFKQFLTRQMEMDKDRQNRMDIENQIVDALLKETKLTVPQTLVKRQLEHRLGDLIERVKSQGMPETEIKKKEEEWRKDLQPAVERDVKAFLVFDAIAKEEKITVSENESLPNKVMAFLLKEAQWEEAV